MKAVVDTNVVAYLLLGTQPFAAEARECVGALDLMLAPAHWEAEIGNVVWMAVRTGVIQPDDGSHRLRLARQLGVESVAAASLLDGALARSLASGIAVYDTLFVELAVREECPLATFDTALRKAFPAVAVAPSALA